MKRVIIVGSPRSNGRSAHLAEMLFEANIDERPEDELYLAPVSELEIGPCIGCDGCRKLSDVVFATQDGGEEHVSMHRCVFNDDMQDLYDQLDDADELVIVSPVFFSGAPAPMKALLDRLQPYFWSRIDARRERDENGTPLPPKRPATLHIVGSDDNSLEDRAEHSARQAAAIAWMRQAFAAAKAENSPGLVLISHANPDFENRWTRSYASRYVRSVRGADAPKAAPATPYDPFLDALIEQVQNYPRPVLYVHGDTHIFRIGKPLLNPRTERFFENFTRLETFGWPDSGWVRVVVNPANPQLFEMHPETLRSNSANFTA